MNQIISFEEFRLPLGAAPVACVDIGGTKVAVSIADARGVRGRVAEPTAIEGAPDALAQQIIRLVGQQLPQCGRTGQRAWRRWGWHRVARLC
jgi:glucokinase